MTKHKVIGIMVSSEDGEVRVFCNPAGDGLGIERTFKTRAAAEAYAEKEVIRLGKQGYEAEWGCNY